MKFTLIALSIMLISLLQTDKPIAPDCACKAIPLHGKVKVVDSHPDFRVQIVDSFEDIRIDTVSSFPDKCGQWQMVGSFPDFTVQFVSSFPDFTIRYVSSFPGID